LSFAHSKLAIMLTGMGDIAGAEENYDAALTGGQRLPADDPGSNEDRQTVSGAYLGKSRLAELTGDFATAAEYSDKYATMEPSGQSIYSVERLYLAAARSVRTPASGKANFWQAARDAAQRCLEFLQAQATKVPLGPNDAGIQRLASRDLAQCDAALAVVQ